MTSTMQQIVECIHEEITPTTTYA